MSMSERTVYVVRYVESGKYMPQLPRGGYSGWTPDVQSLDSYYSRFHPRIFWTYRSAFNAVSAWARGPIEIQHESFGLKSMDKDLKLVVNLKVKRTRNQLEIVELLLLGL